MAALAGRIQAIQSQPRSYTLDPGNRNRRVPFLTIRKRRNNPEAQKQARAAERRPSERACLEGIYLDLLRLVVVSEAAGQVECNQREARLPILVVLKADDMLVTLGACL